MRKIIQKLLYFLAHKIVKKYNVKIIGITGSIGKSSSKDAIYLLLKNKFNVRKSIKNYNNELGVPLTIIGVESGSKNILKWIKNIFIAIKLLVKTDKNYPEILILEMGADHPGDIEYLVKLAPLDIGILTHIAEVHLEYFKNLDGVFKEKKNIVSFLKKDGLAIINGDDAYFEKIKNSTKAKVISYGFKDGVDLQLYTFNKGNTLIEGFKGKILYQDNMIPFHFPNLIADFSLYAILTAIAVGISQGMNIIECINYLKDYKLPKGRLQLLKGKNNSLLIDDTYNASPQAVKSSIKMLNDFNNEKYRKIFILGDMLELGEKKEEFHKEIAFLLEKTDIDVVITVGALSEIIHDYLKLKTNKEVHHFEHSKYLKEFLKHYINENDLYFVKGSQGMRMERVSSYILDDSINPKKVLVRQDDEWLKK